jgi:hypothetical protein
MDQNPPPSFASSFNWSVQSDSWDSKSGWFHSQWIKMGFAHSWDSKSGWFHSQWIKMGFDFCHAGEKVKLLHYFYWYHKNNCMSRYSINSNSEIFTVLFMSPLIQSVNLYLLDYYYLNHIFILSRTMLTTKHAKKIII